MKFEVCWECNGYGWFSIDQIHALPCQKCEETGVLVKEEKGYAVLKTKRA